MSVINSNVDPCILLAYECHQADHVSHVTRAVVSVTLGPMIHRGGQQGWVNPEMTMARWSVVSSDTMQTVPYWGGLGC